ncbi:putative hemolysin secretion/activation protein [Escherichia coli]|uniref:Putative hemolysin secretion/activation protein n=1 Tax=Escherichia coli TaxID=562 RepID=A0A376KID4_ECOLX|nr:putative hemolysin secretion/activation protein [Escherichia coli]
MPASAGNGEPAGLVHSPAPEEIFGEATALSKILQMNASFNLPFTLAGQPFSYSFRYQRQLSNTPLTPQEQFAIGNRWTVRGFDGEANAECQ